MLGTHAKVLIVDDEPSIRNSMLLILTRIGYRARSAEDGFSALAEFRKEVPDVILTDLNMPGMNGFELLSVVRHRFPSVRTIAMSGVYSEDRAPFGVAADAFYQKGRGVQFLLKILGDISQSNPVLPDDPSVLAPVPTQQNGQKSSDDACIPMACTECLQTLPQTHRGSCRHVRETDCFYCRSSISQPIARSNGRTHEQVCDREETARPSPRPFAPVL